MATDEDKKKTDDAEAEASTDDVSSSGEAALANLPADTAGTEPPEGDEHHDDDAPAASQLGSSRYVIAFFFATAICAAYVLGRLVGAIWGKLADTTWVQKNMTFLARVGEDERGEYATLLGGIIAISLVVYAYRRADVRQWTDDVASELAKVTWPDKAEVTNSTVVVIVTSAFATVYLALLDRFWGFVTNLVYGGS